MNLYSSLSLDTALVALKPFSEPDMTTRPRLHAYCRHCTWNEGRPFTDADVEEYRVDLGRVTRASSSSPSQLRPWQWRLKRGEKYIYDQQRSIAGVSSRLTISDASSGAPSGLVQGE